MRCIGWRLDLHGPVEIALHDRHLWHMCRKYYRRRDLYGAAIFGVLCLSRVCRYVYRVRTLCWNFSSIFIEFSCLREASCAVCRVKYSTVAKVTA